MLIPSARYPGQVDVGDPGYPWGKARNAASYQDGTGTPVEKDRLNDEWGFFQSLLVTAGITPSGVPEKVGASDCLLAVQLIASAAGEINAERVMLANWVEAGSVLGTDYKLAWIDAPHRIFVLTGQDGALRTSPDGVAWTTRASGVAGRLRSAVRATSDSAIVAVGATGSITRSVDGINWTAQASGTLAGLEGVTYRNGEFVAVGDNGTVLTSPNGTAWTAQTSGLTTEDLRAITFDGTSSAGTGSLLVAVGSGGTIITSSDGITWATRVSGTANGLRAVAWKAGVFVAVGDGGTIVTSPDGVDWTVRVSDTSAGLRAIATTGHHFVAVGGGAVLASGSGLTWAAITLPVELFFAGQGIAWNGRVCLACSTDNDLIRSLWRLTV